MARRRGMLRAVLGGVAAFALAVGGATAASAEPIEPTGSIAGTVVSETDGTPIAGIEVHAETDGGLGRTDATTDEAGAYVLEGLAAGDYVVRFSSPDGSFVGEYWHDTRDPRSAERVTVAEGAAVAGIDAALGLGGAISGTVTTDADGSPVAGATVSVSGAGGSWASTSTDDSGAYALEGLADDSYVVTFFAEGTDLKREFWEDTEDYSQATPVVIANGETVPAIDAALATGNALEGVVTREDDGSPIENVSVSALDANDEIVGATQTNAAGEYHLGGLPDGSYRVRFGSPDSELASEYWQNAYGWASATLVTVGGQQVLTGIDAALTAMGYISGTVTTSADGAPALVSVLIYDADNRVDVPITDTNSDGTYRVALIPGTYRVLFHPYERGIAEEYWEDAWLWENATLITVLPGEEVDDIDAALDRISAITGTVTLDSDAASKVVVQAWSDGLLVTSTRADAATGTYSLPVPKGSYIVKASATFADGTTTAQPQFYDGVATAAEATMVSPVAGETIDGIDFTLVASTGSEPKPALTLSAGNIRAGDEITVSGTGFAPGAKLSFELHSDPLTLGSLTADAGGELKGTLRIPASAPAGTHTLVALSGSTVVASAALTVTAAPSTGGVTDPTGPADPLASTGGELPGVAALAALALMVLGVTLARRRRRVES